MKSISSFLRPSCVALVFIASPALTQEIETATTMGTVSEFGPERIVLQTEEAGAPMTYSYSKTTTYVDETGAPVSIKTVKTGVPVTVHYTTVGDALVANKVIVRRAAAAIPREITETQTTTTMGTISEFGGDRILVRTESAPEPLAYRFTKTTTYVDEAGQPVSIKTVRSGLPVTVHYTRDGDALVANKVVVRKTTTAPTPRVTRTETTTTTSTGTVTEFGDNRLIIRTESSPDPLSYSYSKTTTYVDEAGNPVPLSVVKSGLPVEVHYTTEGDRRIVDRVIVRKAKKTVIRR